MTLKFNPLSPVTSNSLRPLVGLYLGNGKLFGKTCPSLPAPALSPGSWLQSHPRWCPDPPSPAPLSPALRSPPWSPLRSALKACACPQEAFWCLVQICEVYLPGYYGPHMVRGWNGARGHRGRGWVGGGEGPGDREWRC